MNNTFLNLFVTFRLRNPFCKAGLQDAAQSRFWHSLVMHASTQIYEMTIHSCLALSLAICTKNGLKNSDFAHWNAELLRTQKSLKNVTYLPLRHNNWWLWETVDCDRKRISCGPARSLCKSTIWTHKTNHVLCSFVSAPCQWRGRNQFRRTMQVHSRVKRPA